MYVYDCRIQQETYRADILAFGGMAIHIDVAVRWQVIPMAAPALHLNVGPNYSETLIKPTVLSAVRNVTGMQNHEQLYSRDPAALQDKILNAIRATMLEGLNAPDRLNKKLGSSGGGWKVDTVITAQERLAPILVTDAVVLKVTLPDRINKSINSKFAAAQRIVEERYKVMEALERYKAKYIDAAAMRRTQNIVNPGLNENFLRMQGIQATRDLAQSDNAKLVLVGGGRDGLPIILNPGNFGNEEPRKTAPAGKKAKSTTPPPGMADGGGNSIPDVADDFKWDELVGDLRKLDSMLQHLATMPTPPVMFNNSAKLGHSVTGLENLGGPFEWPLLPDGALPDIPPGSTPAPQGMDNTTTKETTEGNLQPGSRKK